MIEKLKFGKVYLFHDHRGGITFHSTTLAFDSIEDAEKHMCDFMEAIQKARELLACPV